MSNLENNQTVSKPAGGIAPFGYRWQNGTLVIDESESPVRKLIYELFIKHRRKKTVAKLLNDLGYRTRNGSFFSDTTIDRLIRDTTSKGVRHENGKETKVEAIVEPELWEKANNFLGQKTTKPAVHLFIGFAFCFCGGKMIVPGNVDKYVCVNCRHKINTDDLEEIFVSQLSELEFAAGNGAGGAGAFDFQSLSECWQYLTSKEKRIIIEQLLDKIIIHKTEINLVFGFQTNPIKTAAVWQHNERGNETPKSESDQEIQPTLNEPLINEIEAAKFLGISRMTLLRRRNANEINFYRVGIRILYSKEKHLLPFLKACEK